MRFGLLIINLMAAVTAIIGFYLHYDGAILPMIAGFILSGIFYNIPFTNGIWYFLVEALYFKEVTGLGWMCLGCWCVLVVLVALIVLFPKLKKY